MEKNSFEEKTSLSTQVGAPGPAEKAGAGEAPIFLGVAVTHRQRHTFQVERESQLLV
jgi:hypothetical protein